MGKEIFGDTNAWDALADGGDPYHETALLFRDEIAGHCRLVVTNYILDELHTLLLMNVGYQRTVAFKRQLDTADSQSPIGGRKCSGSGLGLTERSGRGVGGI